MSRGRKFYLFRPWMDPSSSGKTNGDRPRSLSLSYKDERQHNIKLAVFFTVVALLFVLAEHLGRVQEQRDANLTPDSMAGVSLTLLPLERSGNGVDFSARFRLTNMGNHSVFYPVNTTTSAPVGQLVARAAAASEWISISGVSNERVPAGHDFTDAKVAWIEMLPGGWVDGEFLDTGRSQEEHACVIYVKPTRDGNGIRILSNSYVLPPS